MTQVACQTITIGRAVKRALDPEDIDIEFGSVKTQTRFTPKQKEDRGKSAANMRRCHRQIDMQQLL